MNAGLNIKKLVLVREPGTDNETRKVWPGYEATILPGDHTPWIRNTNQSPVSTLCIIRGSGQIVYHCGKATKSIAEGMLLKLPEGYTYAIVAGKQGLNYCCSHVK